MLGEPLQTHGESSRRHHQPRRQCLLGLQPLRLDGPEKGSGKPNGNAAADDFAASYDYPDATGVVRFQKVRNLPGRKPRFWLRRPDGNGGWINGTEGVDTTLIYRLPEINEAIAVGYTDSGAGRREGLR